MINKKNHTARPSKAFPRPWTLEIKDSYLNIKAANGDYVISDWDISVDPSVGMMGDPEADVANFELIVSAVNAIKQTEEQTVSTGWWCPHCRKFVDGHEVSFHEYHEVCGYRVGDPPAEAGGEQKGVTNETH